MRCSGSARVRGRQHAPAEVRRERWPEQPPHRLPPTLLSRSLARSLHHMACASLSPEVYLAFFINRTIISNLQSLCHSEHLGTTSLLPVRTVGGNPLP